uniref:hypothetical protein n=1 Tax=uncultured Nevskia sp. TaxID=228950 RepID=UPI0025DF1511
MSSIHHGAHESDEQPVSTVDSANPATSTSPSCCSGKTTNAGAHEVHGHHQHDHPHGSGPAAVEVKDPVCGMT